MGKITLRRKCMNKDFPRIMTLLRKERGLSQKQAAADLDVTQALLSHYENGKRECGLDFLVRAADYYKVSVDYLLGRSPMSSGASINSNIPAQTPDLPENTVIVPQNDGFVNSFFHIQRSAANSTDRTPPRCHRRTPAAS